MSAKQAQKRFQGVFTAIVTPFKRISEEETEVDIPALERLVEFQIEAGCAGIVPVGTTGESPTVTEAEAKLVIETCIKKAAGRCLVIAGTGSNNTHKAAEMTLWAKEAGADAALVVIPYYNKPIQEGLYQHFKAIAAKAKGLPIVLYNIPGRCGIQLTPETVARLYKDIDEVVAIKEATGSLDVSSEIASLCDINILSGDDSLTLPIMSIGGTGVISVLSNWAPEKVLEIVDPALKGDFKKAAKAHRRLFNLSKTMFIQANPQPVKAAMAMLGMCEDVLRLPMISCDDATRAKIAGVMKEYGYKPQEIGTKNDGAKAEGEKPKDADVEEEEEEKKAPTKGKKAATKEKAPKAKKNGKAAEEEKEEETAEDEEDKPKGKKTSKAAEDDEDDAEKPAEGKKKAKKQRTKN